MTEFREFFGRHILFARQGLDGRQNRGDAVPFQRPFLLRAIEAAQNIAQQEGNVLLPVMKMCIRDSQ